MPSKKIDARKQALSAGEVARRCEIAVSAVHFYEAEGLIHGWRNKANHRRYSRHVLRRVALIKIAQQVGVSLKDIKAALAVLPPEQAPTAEQWQVMSRQWRDLLNEKIARLTMLRDQMGECIGCGCLSLTACPLRNPDDCLADRDVSLSGAREDDLGHWLVG